MTALCPGGGPSGAKPGVAAEVVWGATTLAGLLVEWGGPWLIPVASIAAPIDIAISTFCSTDPPADVALTGAEWAALLKLTNDATFNSAVTKLTNTILHQAWWQLCQCTSGTTPAQPPISAPPSGVGTTPTGGTTGPCPTYSTSFIYQGQASGGDISAKVVPGNSSFSVSDALSGTAQAQVWTPRPQGFNWSWSCTAATPSESPQVEFRFVNADGTSAGNSAHLLASGSSGTSFQSWIGGVAVVVDAQEDTQLNHNTVCTVSMTPTDCAGGNPINQCAQCTDPQLLALLTQIMQKLNIMEATIGAPTQAYGHLILGPATAGLHGAGFISATGAIAVRVDLTTVPSYIGVEQGNPNRLYGVGWITPLTQVGAADRFIIKFTREVFYLPIGTADIQYFFEPGVVATLTLVDGTL